MHPSTSSDFVDGRPYLQRNALNPISTAEALRDQLYDRLASGLRDAGVEALLAKSPPYSPTVWTRVEIWRRLPDSEVVSGRSGATITILPKPFHRFPHELTLDYQVCGRNRRVGPLSGVPDEVLPRLIGQLNGSMPIERLPLPKLRTASWQLWRPRNRLDRVRLDPLPVISVVLLVIAFAAGASGDRALWSALLVGLGGVIGLIFWVREPRLVLSTGKPTQEPRQLLRMDSWQTVLRGVGSYENEVRSQLSRELERSRPAEATFGMEDIWYWGVDGKEERRQVVVTFRRAVGFVQVYAYQQDLYVGWDVHVNGGTWTEVIVKDGIERGTGLRVVANSIASAWHVPNEYDITDTNYLGEWIHAIVVERVKEVIEAHKITQEIDFSILREDRRTVVGAEQTKKGKERGGGGARALIRRLR